MNGSYPRVYLDWRYMFVRSLISEPVVVVSVQLPLVVVSDEVGWVIGPRQLVWPRVNTFPAALESRDE